MLRRISRFGGTAMRYVLGRIWARPGMRDEYMPLAMHYVATSRAEAGCVYFDQGPMPDDPDGIVLIECWQTPAHHAAHGAAPHVKAFGPTFETYVRKAIFDEIDAEGINPIVIDFGNRTS
jgi:quinol monooxygenase YgiN